MLWDRWSNYYWLDKFLILIGYLKGSSEQESHPLQGMLEPKVL